MCDSYDSDNDGDELCTRDVNHSWNPEGVIMPSVFTNPKAILAAVDDLAISLNKEVYLCATAYSFSYLCILARVATPSFILHAPLCSIRNGRSGSVATQRSLCVSISYRLNWHTNCV